MRNPRSWHRAILLIGCAAASLAASPGCAGLFSNRPTRPLRAPKLDVAGEVRSGTALGGPDDRVRALDGADPLVVRCRALWVERLPPALAPLDGEARLLVEPSSADPVRAVSSLAGGLGHASGLRAEAILAGAAQGEFGRSVPAWDDESPLPPGFRVAFDPGAQAAEAGIPRLAIVAARAATGAEASLVVELEPGSGEPELSLLLETTLRPGAGPVLLAIPRAAAADEPAGLLVALEGLDRFATERGADAVSAELRAPPGTEDAAARRRAVSAAEDERREIGHALRSLDDARERRPALVFLAGRCGAPLALDVALVAEETDLEELARAVREALPEPGDRPATGWAIERATWEFLGRRAAGEKIAPELAGLLAHHGGEAARFPGAIEDLLHGCSGPDALRARLVEENLILLEDAAPASRVRAYDWLAARGAAPEGFDPLAPLPERRAALDRSRNEPEPGQPEGARR